MNEETKKLSAQENSECTFAFHCDPERGTYTTWAGAREPGIRKCTFCKQTCPV